MRGRLLILAATLGACGCVWDQQASQRGPAVPDNPALSQKQIEMSQANTQTCTRVYSIGQKLLASNRDLPQQTIFLTVGQPTPEVFHQSNNKIVVTQGLVESCKTDAELAAVLALEVAKIAAERIVLAPFDSEPEIHQPIDPGHIGGNIAGVANPADPARLQERALYEQEQRREYTASHLPDPNRLARLYLRRAGFAEAELDHARPILRCRRRSFRSSTANDLRPEARAIQSARRQLKGACGFVRFGISSFFNEAFSFSPTREIDIMFRTGRILAVALLAGAIAAAIPACNKSTSSGKPLVAFISNNSFEFWTIAKQGTEAAARETGVDCEFRMPPSGGTAEDQRRIIEDLMVKGVKAIAISPKDAMNQGEFLKEINSKIPLIAVDSDVTDPSARRCYLGTDNIAAGHATGMLLKEALPKGGKFMIFVGKLDVQNAIERRRGLVTELAGGEDKCGPQLEQLKDAKYPIKFGNFELLDTRTDNESQSTCKAKAEDALAQYGDLAAMVGLWAYNPPAMLEAVKGASANHGKVLLIGFDENDETLQGIRDGQIVGTVVQDPYNFGYESVKIMAAYAKGNGDAELAARKDINKDKQIYIRHRIINKSGKAGPLTGDEKIEAVDPFQKNLSELKK